MNKQDTERANLVGIINDVQNDTGHEDGPWGC